MSQQTYLEFHWSTTEPANGESGRGLAERLVSLVRGMEGVHTICDLGCGNGFLAHQLAAFGYEVTGVDASKSGIEHARSVQDQVTFVQSSIDKDIRERTGLQFVDLVISSDVIEHLYRPSDLLEGAASLLKPSGHILITAPYHGYLKNLVLSLSGKMDTHFSALHDGGHIKFFSVRTLSQLLKRHSFRDLKYSYYGRAPWLWKNMICLARKID
jgi:2-polyprenyl-3-methyl-5-hydroxy-6-metoxy-1,4-benzoquinol methylase